MKKFYTEIVLILILILVLGVVLGACETKEQKHYVVFIADGKEVSRVETEGNEAIALPEAPEVDGYVFAGWYLDRWVWKDAFDGNEFLNGTVDHDVKVYAYYVEKKTYGISFYADGTLVNTVNSAGNESITLPEAPEKKGYEFKGWYLDDGVWNKPFTADYFADKATDGDVNVYAKYEKSEVQPPEPTKYDINFYADGALVKTVNSAGNESITLPEAPEKKDYEFKGWYLDDGVWSKPFTADYFADKATDGDVNVYAKYEKSEVQPPEPTQYKITFYADGEVVDTVKTAGNETVSLPSAPVKQHYAFEGWYLDNGVWSKPFTADYFADKATTEDVKVYAKYERVKYAIYFYEGNSLAFTIKSAGNESLSLPPATEKQHYTFEGWYLDNGVWNKPFTSDYFADTATTEDVKVYAKYVRVKYDIIFHADGKVVETVESAGNESITLPEAPDKTDYEFKGWYLDDGVWSKPFTADYFADKATTGDVDVYARYYYAPTVPEYLVVFDTDGGSDVESVRTSVIETEPFTEKPGFEFDGWYLDEGFLNKVTFPFNVTQACTLYAKWVAKDVVFTLDENNMISGMSGVPADGELYIPGTVNGVQVAGIANYAFRDNDDIVSVVVDDSITDFGLSCFSNCRKLQKVKISDRTTSLPDFMFQWCVSLSDFEMPSSLVSISEAVFQDSALTSVTLPSTVRTVGRFAFKECASLTHIDLGKVETLAEGVFQDCTSLTSITIPDTVTKINGNNMFAGSTALAEIYFPDKELLLNYNFLNGTAYYNDAKNWQDGILYLGKHLITVNSDFNAKTTVTVREGTLTIANLAFYQSYGSAKLTTLNLPEGLKAIGERAFEGCKQLANTVIPDSVESVGADAFNNTALLNSGQTTYLGNWLIRYVLPSGSTEITVREGTIGIADGELTTSQGSVTKVTLPSTLKYIGASNFYYMTSLKTINAPASLVRIGDDAFNYCMALESFDTKDCKDLRYVGASAFSWCKKLTSFSIPSATEYVGSMAFNQCQSITVYVDRAQGDVPAGWDKKWDFTYASSPLNVVWNS